MQQRRWRLKSRLWAFRHHVRLGCQQNIAALVGPAQVGLVAERLSGANSLAVGPGIENL
jgi:hypothetical protein